MREPTYENLKKANDLLMKQKPRVPTLVFSPEHIDMLKREDRIRIDKDGRMWMQNWYEAINGIEVFTSEYLEPNTLLYIKDKDKI